MIQKSLSRTHSLHTLYVFESGPRLNSVWFGAQKAHLLVTTMEIRRSANANEQQWAQPIYVCKSITRKKVLLLESIRLFLFYISFVLRLLLPHGQEVPTVYLWRRTTYMRRFSIALYWLLIELFVHLSFTSIIFVTRLSTHIFHFCRALASITF